jgi:NADH-quinone oxidoreductase subunit A
MSPTSITAYIVLFGSVGLLFLLVSLLLGRLLRPAAPSAEKLDSYECGEPAVGSSFVQFDLRFYVVALVFIVFEVEVALFFPPAVIYGAATHWLKADGGQGSATKFAKEMGVVVPQQTDAATAGDARALALAAAADLAAFFAVILLGFAYVWRRGDLNWVRAIDTVRQPDHARMVPEADRRAGQAGKPDVLSLNH